jgi:UDP-2,3-diacylglucosamine hydrolase
MKTTYFISDTHFGSTIYDDTKRIDLWKKFLSSIEGSNSELYLLGDIFDFWIEYGDKVREIYKPILISLKKLVDSGVEVTFVRGNHDFMRGNYLSDKIGLRIIDKELVLNIQNSFKVTAQHGDQIKRTLFSSIRNFLIRSPKIQKIYSLLPPFLGVPIAQGLSDLSKKKSSHCSKECNSDYKNELLGKANSIKKNVYIMGHTHEKELSKSGNDIYANCGSWLIENSLVKIDDGTISLIELIHSKSILQNQIKSIKL